MSCNDIQWRYKDAARKLSERRTELEQAESRRYELTSRHSDLQWQIDEKESQIARLERALVNADGPDRAGKAMELSSVQQERDALLTERGQIDGSLRVLRRKIGTLQAGIASAENAMSNAEAEWQAEGCEGNIAF